MEYFVSRYWHLGATVLTLSLLLVYFNSNNTIFKDITPFCDLMKKEAIAYPADLAIKTKYPDFL